EKRVTPDVATDSVWVGWNEHTEGLASQWWRENILASPEIMALYAPQSHAL
ncbi:MAG TPA: LysR family transcriptional regulator, partial [Enterobacteriaceae bacterium]|nr:LysR family transcriptional regulator [Enterobacteriaceae bacterium]